MEEMLLLLLPLVSAVISPVSPAAAAASAFTSASTASDADVLGTEYYGQLLGRFSDELGSLRANVFIVDQRTILVQDFEAYYEPGENVYLYAGTLKKDGSYTKTGFALTNLKGAVRPLTSERKQLFLFPEGRTIYGVDWIGVISRKKRSLHSRLLVDTTTKLLVPQPQPLESFAGRNGLSSASVIVVDSKNIVIKNLTFKALAPDLDGVAQFEVQDSYFWVGLGSEPDETGIPVPDEAGSLSPLRRYRGQNLVLSLPSGTDIFDIDWISIWSKGLGRSLAHVNVPAMTLNVPPALETLGIQSQSKLNCELLSSSIGLELRWTLDSSDILLQLVSSTGNDRYLALGIRSDGSDSVSGDVFVGWINSRNGRGGVDDYFLAGDGVQCEDEAESCPDISKQGGGKDIELLNSVSRDNYTMLTVRRPLEATDDFDVDVRLDRPQKIFWSIGFKSPEMRRRHKPIKNQGPVLVDFGRVPAWNCPQEADEDISREAEVGATAETPSPLSSSPPPPSSSPWPRYPAITTTPLRHLRNNRREETEVEAFTESPRPLQPVTSASTPSYQAVPPPTKPPSAISDWSVPDIGCSQAARGPLYFQIGPAAMHRGNQGLGPSGEALYVNGLLAPDLFLVRGHPYTVVVETGLGVNPDVPFHPLYITSDPVGGHMKKTELQKKTEQIFAGVHYDREAGGEAVPRGLGRICLWTAPRPFVTYATYADFHNQLELGCAEEKRPGVFSFRPTWDMPDTIYYQSFTANHLGGVIHLVDRCDEDIVRSNAFPLPTFRPELKGYIENKKEDDDDEKEDEISLLRTLLRARSRMRNDNSNVVAQPPVRRGPNLPHLRLKQKISPHLYNEDGKLRTAPGFDLRRLEDKKRECMRRKLSQFDVSPQSSFLPRSGFFMSRGRREAETFKDNSEMPVFEHFPMREISSRSKKTPRHIDFEAECEEEARQELKTTMGPRFYHSTQKPTQVLGDVDLYNMAPYEETPLEKSEQPAWSTQDWHDDYDYKVVGVGQDHEIIDVVSRKTDILRLRRRRKKEKEEEEMEDKEESVKAKEDAEEKKKTLERPDPILDKRQDTKRKKNKKTSFSSSSGRNFTEVSNQRRPPPAAAKPRTPLQPAAKPRPSRYHPRPLRNPFASLMRPFKHVFPWLSSGKQQQQQQQQQLPRRRHLQGNSPLAPPGNFPVAIFAPRRPWRPPRPPHTRGGSKKAQLRPPRRQQQQQQQQQLDDRSEATHLLQEKQLGLHQTATASPRPSTRNDDGELISGPLQRHHHLQQQQWPPAAFSGAKLGWKSRRYLRQRQRQKQQRQRQQQRQPPETRTTLSNLSPLLQKFTPSPGVFDPGVAEVGGFVPVVAGTTRSSAVPPLAFNVLDEVHKYKEKQREKTGQNHFVASLPAPQFTQLSTLLEFDSRPTVSNLAVDKLVEDYDDYNIKEEGIQLQSVLDYYDYWSGEIEEEQEELEHGRSSSKVSEVDFSEFKTVVPSASAAATAVAAASRPRGYEEKDRIDLPNQPIMTFKVGASIKQEDEEGEEEPLRIAVGSVGGPELAYPISAAAAAIAASSAPTALAAADGAVLDPNSFAYAEQKLPYGHQFPSYASEKDSEEPLFYDGDEVDDDDFSGTTDPEKMRLLKERLGLEELEDEDMIAMIERMHG